MLLDLDGCLIDSAAATRTTLAAVASCATGRRLQADALPDDALHRPRTTVLAELGVRDLEEAVTRWWEGAWAGTSPAALFPGIPAALARLREAGARLGIVTAQDRLPARLMIPPALDPLIETAVTRQDAPAKPRPDGLHTALARLGIAPTRAIMVGDSPRDMTAARTAGVQAAAAAWGWSTTAALQEAGAQQVLPDPDSLATLTPPE